MLSNGGSGNSWVKDDGSGGVEVGADNQAQVSVKSGGVTVNKNLTIVGELSALSGGLAHDFEFVKYRPLQGTVSYMTASVFDFSGSAAQGNSTRIVYTRVPLMRAGSVLGVALLTEDATVKSGSLSGTVLIDGTPTTATVGMHTGTIASRILSKDDVTFSANSYMQVQLTASATYLTDTDPTSGSFMAVVMVEY